MTFDIRNPQGRDPTPPIPKKKMPAPRHAWIQDAEVAKAIDKSNTIRREHLRDQLSRTFKKFININDLPGGDHSLVIFHWKLRGEVVQS